MFETAKTIIGKTPKLGVSAIALLAAGCASHASYYDEARGYDYPNTQYDTTYDSYRSGPYQNADYSRYRGIEGAREAHRRFAEYKAEQLDGNCESEVRIYSGETLSDIAEFCDVPVASIIQVNPQVRNPRYVSAGERIRIPATRGEVYEGSGYGYRTADYRNDRNRFDRRNSYRRNVSHDGDGDYYTVRPGDTLAEIAQRFDVSLRDIARENPYVEPRRLEVGQRVYLPDYADGGRGHYRDARLDGDTPAISVSPSYGPRDGKIRVSGRNFDQGEEVRILFGNNRDDLVELKLVETDGDGRIDEVVRLPDNYDYDEAYFALQPHGADRYFMSDEAYAVRGRRANVAHNDGRRFGDWDSSGAQLGATDSDVTWDGKVSLVARGFPRNTPVSIYGGPNRNSLVKVAETRTGPSGKFAAEVDVPDTVEGDSVLYVAAIEDGPRTIISDRIRVLNPDQGYVYSSNYVDDAYHDDNYDKIGNIGAQSPRTLERGVKTSSGLFSRFRRSPTHINYAEPTHNGGIDSAGQSAISGVLTDEGKNCPSLRDDAGNLYSLLGDLEGYDDGDRVLVRGSVQADDRICGQARTVQVFEIEEAPW